VLGAKKKALAGFSAASTQPHQGFVSGCDVVLGTPPALRPRAVRLVAGKCALLARVDAYAQDPSGAAGAAMKARRCPPCVSLQEIEQKVVLPRRACLPASLSAASRRPESRDTVTP